MQNFVLHKKFYQINKIDESEYSKAALERYEKLRLYRKLRDQGCSETLAFEAIGMSRATYYRWNQRYKDLGLEGLEERSTTPNNVRKTQWTKETENLVLKFRSRYRLWGKHKLAAIIKRECNIALSASMIGRILKKLIAMDKIKPVVFYYGKLAKRPRIFNAHAKRWKYGMESSSPGELIQIDHMTISVPGMPAVKSFKAVCPFTKLIVEQAYDQATSNVAAEFLKIAAKAFPFSIKSIQVDGGSEFMGAFETLCQELNIPLYVLPPRRPKYNSIVERSNGATKYEFYHQYSGPGELKILRQELQKYVQFYNNIRPHQGIGYLTPHEFCSQLGIRP